MAQTQKKLVIALSKKLGLSADRTDELAKGVFSFILEMLMEDGRVELRDFGVWIIKRRRVRREIKNPNIIRRARNVVVFLPGKNVRATVREMTNVLEEDLPPLEEEGSNDA